MPSSSIVEKPAQQPAADPAPTPPVDNGVQYVEIFGPGAAAVPEEPAAGALPEDQDTVISKRPPLSGKVSSVSPAAVLFPSNASELGRSLEGTLLDHFRLENFVGGGGMGAVFRAVDTMLGRIVAVKVLSRDRTDPDTLRRFKNEAQSSARLDHDNIARVHYVGEHQGLHYIVFEFIEGTNLRDLVAKKGPLPVGEAISYVLQVAEALEHASQRGVVHRDIKPSNVLITAEGRAKLVDMGLARLRLDTDADELTASGVTLGTFDYISPEQARDPRVADVRSDLYSLGCTLYFMLTGRPPFPDGNVLQKLLSHSSEQPADPRTLRPDLDEAIVRTLFKLLSKQPSQRHQQPSELIGELLVLADRLSLPGLPRGGTVWVTPPQSKFSKVERALPWLVPVVLLVAAVFVLDRVWSGGLPQVADQPPAIRLPTQPPPKTPSVVAPPTPQDSPASTKEPISTPGKEPRPVDPPTEKPPATDAGGAAAKKAAEPAKSGDAEPSPTSSPPTEQVPAAKPTESPKPVDNPVSPAPEKPVQVGGEAPEVPVAKPPTSPASPSVQRIIVAASDTPAPADARVVSSLASACLEAAATGAEAIELHFNGPREERPLDIAGPRLTIRNGEGFTPTIVFRPKAADAPPARTMCRVSGGTIAWKGIHVQLDFPTDPAEGWSLFLLDGIESLDVENAVLTIRNVNDAGQPLHSRVAFCAFAGSPRVESDTPADASDQLLPPHLGLTNCVARGQADLIYAEQATPFRLVCRQCLLATPRRLIEMAGARVRPSLREGRVDLVLKNVTAVLGQGLCRLSSSAEAPHQLDLVTDCKDNIIFVTDVKAAVVERSGVRSPADLDRHLYLRGRNNFYLGSAILLRIDPTGSPADFVDLGFERRMEEWFQEESPQFAVMWKTPPPADVPHDRHRPLEYFLDESDRNPAINAVDGIRAGADPTALPTPPADSPTTAAPATLPAPGAPT